MKRSKSDWKSLIVKPDVSIAKNYLKESELEDMGRIVNSFLDLAEDMAKRHIPMTMEDWAKRLVIVDGSSINIRQLLIETPLAEAYLTDFRQQMLEIVLTNK